jgi:uncharacterized protein (TIGR02147 family)
MNHNMIKISPFDFNIYHHYLKAAFEARKADDDKFSLQFIANRLGLKSKVQTLRILNGERKHLPSELFPKIHELFHHSPEEEEYFENMVAFNESKTLKSKDKYYQKMHSIIRPVSRSPLGSAQMRFLSRWYIPAIREMICMKSFQGDIKTIAENLKPPISLQEAQDGLQVLLDLNLIQQTPEGRFTQTDVSIDSHKELKNFAVRKYQAEHAGLAAKVLNRSGRQMDRFSGLTFGVTEEGAREIESRMMKFHKELIHLLVRYDKDMDQVYQFNMQLYPLSKPIPSGEKK